MDPWTFFSKSRSQASEPAPPPTAPRMSTCGAPQFCLPIYRSMPPTPTPHPLPRPLPLKSSSPAPSPNRPKISIPAGMLCYLYCASVASVPPPRSQPSPAPSVRAASTPRMPKLESPECQHWLLRHIRVLPGSGRSANRCVELWTQDPPLPRLSPKAAHGSAGPTA